MAIKKKSFLINLLDNFSLAIIANMKANGGRIIKACLDGIMGKIPNKFIAKCPDIKATTK